VLLLTTAESVEIYDLPFAILDFSMSKAVYKKETEVKTDSTLSPLKSGIWTRLVGTFLHLLEKYQILNFMVVGGIGFIVNMAIYYPLTLVFRDRIKIFGQEYFFIPFVISSFAAIICNYELNRIWTFKGWKKQSLAGVRYFSMAAVTLVLDIAMLSFFVFIAKIHWFPAAALAILVVFVIRFIIARNWVWLKH
jgi:putative flippase GtrA